MHMYKLNKMYNQNKVHVNMSLEHIQKPVIKKKLKNDIDKFNRGTRCGGRYFGRRAQHGVSHIDAQAHDCRSPPPIGNDLGSIPTDVREKDWTEGMKK